jgi:hypothetical protein
LEDLSEDGRMIVKWTLKPWNGRGLHGQDSTVSEWGEVGGCCEYGDELPTFIKHREFPD